MSLEVNTYYDLEQRIAQAREMTKARIKQQPDNTLWASFLAQINFIDDFLKRNAIPTQEEKDRVVMGIIAARNLEEDDAEYADMIEWVSWGFKHIEELTGNGQQ
ncbi:MAG: hypothetical protein IT223_05035 [Crocinitomicaceae bacterium]|nr:hypothetical protein [Crocinitomicaceae bacterium]